METIYNSKIKKVMPGAILALFLLCGSFISAKADVIRLQVKEETANCTGVAPQTCMLVKYKSSKDWELFYSGIKGFKYTPGYRYTLSVQRTKRKNVPADASAYTYRLIKVIKKQKIAVKTDDPTSQEYAWAFIAKHRWNLIQLNNKTQENSPAFLVFDITTGKVNGNSGCNSIFGSFEHTANTISFKQLASTMMACLDDKSNQLEREFSQAITGKTFTFDIAEQTLNLYQDGKIVLMFGMAPLDLSQKR
ncbi:DUF4377 domain-containing protein [Pedobacter antarcticus]|uniref:DUF4377 domain-containing protein n=2 Tax=Pedobacter antarcticus TaxID=34086 RepID=A0A081PF86_9SPHI|nr:DUF4377 domain-containing protein [Pedobacter antarcticus]KEQ29359.1 hypothetical protein N180_07375 [Pedobacter antarcticus 4BY]SDL96944.1 Heat shock protein HslJ [Pedobacter antarcticus]